MMTIQLLNCRLHSPDTMRENFLPMLNIQADLETSYDCVINEKITNIRLKDINSRFIVLVFYPFDFTFVCPTEILKISDIHEEFRKLDTTVLFISGDSVYSHLCWIQKKREDGGIGNINWPLVSDVRHIFSSKFNLFNSETGSVMRSTVILNKERKSVHLSVNIDPIGRSSTEIIRLIEALKFNEENGEICPINFSEGK